jgi:hypothetical protein
MLKNSHSHSHSFDDSDSHDSHDSHNSHNSHNSHKNSDKFITKSKNDRSKLLDEIEPSINKFRKYTITDKYKHLLCKNILTHGTCNYGNNCKFAHSLEEQIVEPIYKKVADIVMGDGDLSKINIYTDKELYNILLKKCILCENCNAKLCTGGYNCRNGSLMKKYIICQKDLNEGTCNKLCKKIHLTERGLIPYMNHIIPRQPTQKKPQKIKPYQYIYGGFDFETEPDLQINFNESIFETDIY